MKILILGGGIKGLSAAWYAKKRFPHAKITLLEKGKRLGGWIQSSNEGGFFFERGPRTFQFSRSKHLLALIDDLKLKIIRSDPASARRFILHQGKLKDARTFLPWLIPYLLREPFIKARRGGDESIYDFAARRFSPKIAETLFDPMTLGIYAGDIRKLSIKACFPLLYQWEQEKGSVVRGLFSQPKKEKGLFTIENGMDSLINALETQLNIEIVLNAEVVEISENEVFTGGKSWGADCIISALPIKAPYKSLWVVNIGFHKDVLQKKGFGYLAPTQENESILGMIFDSAIFPTFGKRNETRLTAMIKESEKAPLESALSALKRHLKIEESPDYTSFFLAKNAIPQFEVGCKIHAGISVDACIQIGKSLINSIT